MRGWILSRLATMGLLLQYIVLSRYTYILPLNGALSAEHGMGWRIECGGEKEE